MLFFSVVYFSSNICKLHTEHAKFAACPGSGQNKVNFCISWEGLSRALGLFYIVSHHAEGDTDIFLVCNLRLGGTRHGEKLHANHLLIFNILLLPLILLIVFLILLLFTVNCS